jgi:spermidine synthase
LKLIALLCGAALMGLEMAGARIVSPHFGSTIYVWGAIIGIFMGALAIGYWGGGKLADRRPCLETLGFIILLAAVMVFIIPLIANPVCRYLTDIESLGPKWRALLGGTILYALPSICLGMVSPFVVRLAARSVTGLGSVAGSLYAVSTLGSIIGTFLVSFVLTEYMGSKAIIWSIGGMLVLVSALCFGSRLLGKGGAGVAIGAVLFLLTAKSAFAADVKLWFPPTNDPAKIKEAVDSGKLIPSEDGLPADIVLDSVESAYHYIGVVQSFNYLKCDADERDQRSRQMTFNNQTESAIEVVWDPAQKKCVIPEGSVQSGCSYTRLLHLGVVFTKQAPRRALVIGCGGWVGPQAFLDDYKGIIERVDVVDIDPAVFRTAEKWFRYPMNNDIIKSHVEDGRLFVRNSADKWDYVILDAYTTGGQIPHHLITQEFFQTVRLRLDQGGVVVANIISALEGKDSRLYRSVYKTMQSVFGEGKIYAFPKKRTGRNAVNIIIVAAPDSPAISGTGIKRNFLELENILLKQPDLKEPVENVQISTPELEDVPLLTDDFCPTDSMVHD